MLVIFLCAEELGIALGKETVGQLASESSREIQFV